MAAARKPRAGADPFGGSDDEYTADEPSTDIIEVRVQRPQPEARRVRLRQVQGPGAPRDIEWTFGRLVVGDAQSADLRIPGAGLAPRHVIFEQRHQIYFCIDLSPREGLRLNGLAVHSAALAPGDRVEFGDVIFEFVDSAPR